MPTYIDETTLESLIELRHRLHASAEVSGEEQETAAVITDFLKSTHPDNLKTDIGGFGILATYDGEDDGTHVLIRCELDGLPISDNIDAEYKSKTEGVAHKCGHDGHMAIVAGVAQLLGESRSKSGKVSLLFQPAEETGEGARRVINDPKFKKLNPDYCFALHNLPGFEKNKIITKEQTFAAASVGLIIKYKGTTAHAAHPDEGQSPALAVAQTIEAFSAIPQFHVPLEHSAKVTIIHAAVGERAFGTSPGEGTVMATLRTYEDDLLGKLKDQSIQIAEGIAQTYSLDIDVEWVEPFAATVNDEKSVRMINSATEELGLQQHPKKEPFSWSEDFGHFSQAFSGAMFGLGAGVDQPALHAETYDFPDDIIETGIKMFMQIIKEATQGR